MSLMIDRTTRQLRAGGFLDRGEEAAPWGCGAKGGLGN